MTGASALTGEAELLAAEARAVGLVDRARIATRSCDGRLLAAAGVNLKSAPEALPRLSEAASRGSADAGVKLISWEKDMERAGARRFCSPAARAGESRTPAARAAAATFTAVERPKLRNPRLPLHKSYRLGRLKVP